MPSPNVLKCCRAPRNLGIPGSLEIVSWAIYTFKCKTDPTRVTKINCSRHTGWPCVGGGPRCERRCQNVLPWKQKMPGASADGLFASHRNERGIGVCWGFTKTGTGGGAHKRHLTHEPALFLGVSFPGRVVTGVAVGTSPLRDGRFSAEATRACPALSQCRSRGASKRHPGGMAAPPARGPN